MKLLKKPYCTFWGTIMIKAAATSTASIVAYSFFLAKDILIPRKILHQTDCSCSGISALHHGLIL
jgi:hypothetical protein